MLQQCDMLALAGIACISTYGQALAAKTVQDRWMALISCIAPDIHGATFLAVMRDTNTTLSGGAAAMFLQPTSSWKPGDFDFFCARPGYETFCVYLIDILHGTVITHETQDDLRGKSNTYECQGIVDRHVIQTKHATFDVLCAEGCTPLTAVAQFYSTHLMNSVSADAVCMAYPAAFFNNSGIVRGGTRACGVVEGIAKWGERGFRMADNVDDLLRQRDGGECSASGHCPQDFRFFGDKHCLTFHFNRALATDGGQAGCNLNQVNFRWTAGWIFEGQPCAHELHEHNSRLIHDTAWIMEGFPIV